jgi:hypothetical protein
VAGSFLRSDTSSLLALTMIEATLIPPETASCSQWRPPESLVEGMCGAAVGESAAEVAVLGHGHVGVSELLGDLAGGQLVLVEQRCAGLAEHVTGDPDELAGAAGLA